MKFIKFMLILIFVLLVAIAWKTGAMEGLTRALSWLWTNAVELFRRFRVG